MLLYREEKEAAPAPRAVPEDSQPQPKVSVLTREVKAAEPVPSVWKIPSVELKAPASPIVEQAPVEPQMPSEEELAAKARAEEAEKYDILSVQIIAQLHSLLPSTAYKYSHGGRLVSRSQNIRHLQYLSYRKKCTISSVPFFLICFTASASCRESVSRWRARHSLRPSVWRKRKKIFVLPC